MVAPGSTLEFGQSGEAYVAEFVESGGGGAMAQTLMKAMASQASKQVQEKMQEMD